MAPSRHSNTQDCGEMRIDACMPRQLPVPCSTATRSHRINCVSQAHAADLAPATNRTWALGSRPHPGMLGVSWAVCRRQGLPRPIDSNFVRVHVHEAGVHGGCTHNPRLRRAKAMTHGSGAKLGMSSCSECTRTYRSLLPRTHGAMQAAHRKLSKRAMVAWDAKDLCASGTLASAMCLQGGRGT